MANYQINITDEDSADGMWCAALFEELGDGRTGDMIASGIGYTVREAVSDLDWNHGDIS